MPDIEIVGGAAAAPSGIAGLPLYGDGSDGSLTLGADTTMTAGQWIRNYNNLTLAGFKLSVSSTDKVGVLRIQNTLSLGGGQVTAADASGNSPGAAPPANASGGGRGGAGGNGAGSLFVYARLITGTGSIIADGTAGGAGGNATPPTADELGTNGSSATGSLAALGYTNLLTANAAGADGLNARIGGAGARCNDPRVEAFADPMMFVFETGGYISPPSQPVQGDDKRLNYGTAGASGSTSHANIAGGAGIEPDGGGGGGGTVFFRNTTGPTGGDGGDLGVVVGSGGGGGGGGGSAAVVLVVTDSAPSTLTVGARGGAGGSGGNGSSGGAGGGGGGGGGGGQAVLVAQAGNTATVSGAAGAGGAGGAGAAAGSSGTTGVAGRGFNITR